MSNDACREAYEKWINEHHESEDPFDWHVWQYAWDAARLPERESSLVSDREGFFVHYTARENGRSVINSAVMKLSVPFSTIDNVTNMQGSIEELWGYEKGSCRITFWKRMEPTTSAEDKEP